MSPGDGDVRLGVTVRVAGDSGLAVVLGGDGGDHRRGDELGSVAWAVVVFGRVDRADLASHLLPHWLTHLAADWLAVFHRGLDGDSAGHSTAALSGHGNTGSLGDLADHGVTHSHGLGLTHSLGDFSLDNLTVLSGHGGTLGHGLTLGHCDAVGGDDLLVDRGADRDVHTVRDGHTLGDGDTDRDLDTVRDGHRPAGLHWDTPALSLNLLLALLLPGSHGHHGGQGDTGLDWSSRAGQAIEDKLRISLGLGISLALDDLGGNKSRVEAESADQRTNSGGGSQEASGLGLDQGNSGVGDDSLGQLDLSVNLLADVCHQVLALNITNINIDNVRRTLD